MNLRSSASAVARILCVFALAFLCLSSPAATVRYAFTNMVGQADTNWFLVYPVDANPVMADGSVRTIGPAIRLTPASNGHTTNTLEVGNYMVTNRFLGRGLLFRVPNDHGATVYCATCGTNNSPVGTGLAISGFNTFVTIVYGTNPPPTYDEVTNALGYLPVRVSQLNTNELFDLEGDLTVSGISHILVAPDLGLDATLNWEDMTLSRYGTNVLDWFNSWLVGTWRANGALFTNIPQSGVTGLSNSLAYLTNAAQNAAATNVIDVAAGINITIVTNGLLRTIAASVSPETGAITNGETRAVLIKGPNSATWSLTNRGTAMMENGMIVSNRTAPFEIRTADGVVQLRQQYNETGIKVTYIHGDGGGLTNLQGTFTGSGASLTNLPFFTNATTLYVDKNGSDSSGLRGRLDLPFLTISNAIANSSPGDTIRIGPGRYLEERVVPKNGQTIIGSGGSNTLVASSFTLGSIFQLTNNLIAKGLTIHATLTDGTYQFPIGGGSGVATNVNLYDFNIIGNSDALYITDSGDGLYQINAWNCYWKSGADTCNLNQGFNVDEFDPEESHIDSTNTFVNLYNCVLECEWTYNDIVGGLCRGLSTRNSTIRMVGGRIRSRNAPVQTSGAYLSQGDSGAGKIELSGVMIETSSTNGIVSDVTNHQSNGFIYINGSPYDKVHGTNIVLKGAMWVTNSTISTGGIRPALSNMVVGVGVNPTTGVGKIALNPDGSAKFADNALSIRSNGRIQGQTDSTLSISAEGGITNALATFVGDEFSYVLLQNGNLTWTDLATGDGSAITGDDEAYGVGWDSDTTFPTKNALYDKIQTITGGGGSGAEWKTNGNSALPAGSFLGTLDNFTLKLASSNAVLAAFDGYSNTVNIGTFNTISGWQPHSSITGGRGNLINSATNSAFHYQLGYNHIGGGATNFIVGGLAGGSVIGGGVNNVIVDEGLDTIVIAGGDSNSSTNSSLVTIGGGNQNRVGRSDLTANYATIGGGVQNFIPGAGNANLTNEYATIGGGFSNRASGAYSAIPGGNQNQASGSNSFAAGFRARATHPGSFVLTDVSSATAFASAADNEFSARFSGGYRLTGGGLSVNSTNVISSSGSEINSVGFTNNAATMNRLVGNGSAPTATVSTAGAGTGATASTTGTDLAHLTTIITGTSPASDVPLFTNTFAKAFSSAPIVVVSVGRLSTSSGFARPIQVWSVTTTNYTVAMYNALTAATGTVFTVNAIVSGQ